MCIDNSTVISQHGLKEVRLQTMSLLHSDIQTIGFPDWQSNQPFVSHLYFQMNKLPDGPVVIALAWVSQVLC